MSTTFLATILVPEQRHRTHEVIVELGLLAGTSTFTAMVLGREEDRCLDLMVRFTMGIAHPMYRQVCRDQRVLADRIRLSVRKIVGPRARYIDVQLLDLDEADWIEAKETPNLRRVK